MAFQQMWFQKTRREFFGIMQHGNKAEDFQILKKVQVFYKILIVL